MRKLSRRVRSRGVSRDKLCLKSGDMSYPPANERHMHKGTQSQPPVMPAALTRYAYENLPSEHLPLRPVFRIPDGTLLLHAQPAHFSRFLARLLTRLVR